MVRQRAAAGPPAPGLDNVTRTQLLFNWHPQQHYEFITFCFSGEALSLPGQYWRYVSLLSPAVFIEEGGVQLLPPLYSGLAFSFGVYWTALALTCSPALAASPTCGRLPLGFPLSPIRPLCLPPGFWLWPIVRDGGYYCAGKMTICPIKHSRCCTAISQLYGDRL